MVIQLIESQNINQNFQKGFLAKFRSGKKLNFKLELKNHNGEKIILFQKGSKRKELRIIQNSCAHTL